MARSLASTFRTLPERMPETQDFRANFRPLNSRVFSGAQCRCECRLLARNGRAHVTPSCPLSLFLALLCRPACPAACPLLEVFLPRRVTSVPYRETALAQVLATRRQTTSRESEPHCDRQ